MAFYVYIGAFYERSIVIIIIIIVEDRSMFLLSRLDGVAVVIVVVAILIELVASCLFSSDAYDAILLNNPPSMRSTTSIQSISNHRYMHIVRCDARQTNTLRKIAK